MTAETAKKLLPIITAFAEGKTIELRASRHDGWTVGTNLDFEIAGFEYRIQPQELFVNAYWNGSDQEVIFGGQLYTREEEARQLSRGDPNFLGVFKFQLPAA